MRRIYYEGLTPQIDLWTSEFGDAYTDRNIYDYKICLPAMRAMLERLELDSILEIGSNYGGKLRALHDINPQWKLLGIEPNRHARQLAQDKWPDIPIVEATIFNNPLPSNSFDLSFTANVLQHIALRDLPRAIGQIYRISSRYILTIEYYAYQETEILYCGNHNALWKRDWMKHFLSLFPTLRLLRTGFWDKNDGFDDSNWWLWEK